MRKHIKVLQKYADRIWYPPLIGMLAALDNFVIIIPNDGILISSSMLTPRRWFALALNVAIGSTVGAIILAAFVETQGLEWILEMYPGINETKSWVWTADFFEKYGNRALIISRFLPYIRTFAPILAGISKMNYPKYIFLNVAGAALWVGSLVGGGYYFGVQFPWIINYVHYVILFFLAITTFTVIKGYLNIKKS